MALRRKKVGDIVDFVSLTPLHLGTCLQAQIKNIKGIIVMHGTQHTCNYIASGSRKALQL